MKIILPENVSDVTLKQFQQHNVLTEMYEDKELNEHEYNYKVVELFSGIPYNQIDNVSHKDLTDILNQITLALNEEVEFKNKFSLNGIDYGFIPNFDEIQTSEYVDLSKYGSETETLHNLIAILFRPITKIDKYGNYEIEIYNGTKETANTMKNTPMNIVNGALVFFLNLSTELLIHTQKYIKAEQARVKGHPITSLNGDGIVQSMT